jgi:preprotein translocase subunit SecB
MISPNSTGNSASTNYWVSAAESAAAEGNRSMADNQSQNGGNGSGIGARQFALDKLYIKDLSFEVPGAPEVFEEEQVDSRVSMNLNNSHRAVGEDAYEVVLHLSLHATVEDRTMFMLEIEQAGTFLISGYAEQEMRQLISSHCPATLFPYAREAISSTISRGGFPAILLQPINFDAVYAQAESNRERPDA